MAMTAAPAPRRLIAGLWAVALAWLLAVIVTAGNGMLARLWPPLIAAIVAATILLPTLAYFASAELRSVAERIGQRRLMLLHIWRIPAALVFFWYGAQGLLPPAFWILAGTGDLIAGAIALRYAFLPESAARYRRFHRFGFADFVVAVGTGLVFTLLEDPRMVPVATLPLALIPLFGVGLSGASHLIAFDMLRRGAGIGR
jgi:hypothetical protein